MHKDQLLQENEEQQEVEDLRLCAIIPSDYDDSEDSESESPSDEDSGEGSSNEEESGPECTQELESDNHSTDKPCNDDGQLLPSIVGNSNVSVCGQVACCKLQCFNHHCRSD